MTSQLSYLMKTKKVYFSVSQWIVRRTDLIETVQDNIVSMAKWGEGDPRWIVEERADATNVNNWHW